MIGAASDDGIVVWWSVFTTLTGLSELVESCRRAFSLRRGEGRSLPQHDQGDLALDAPVERGFAQGVV